MEWGEFERMLDQLGWSQRGVARSMEVHPNTVSKWKMAGEVPGYAAAYVRLAVRVVDHANGILATLPKSR